MVIKYTTQVGDPVIRAKAKEVRPAITPRTKKIVRDLIDSMRAHGLVGMAAPQIGIGARIFVSEIRETQTRHPKHADGVRVFVNPKIVRRSKKKISDTEGCGSVAYAGVFARVPRAASVDITATDLKGKKFRLHATGLLARIMQHEMDHLDGIIFLDRVKDMRTLTARESL